MPRVSEAQLEEYCDILFASYAAAKGSREFAWSNLPPAERKAWRAAVGAFVTRTPRPFAAAGWDVGAA